MNLLIILGCLFLGLLILVPLAERFGKTQSPDTMRSMSRWVIPLVALLLILQILKYYVF